MTAIADTFDSFGVLEHILSFVPVQDVLAATAVSRRFKVAGRSNSLWKDACTTLWKGRTGMGEWEEDMPLFWRSSYSDQEINNLSVRQIRSMFDHFLLQDQKVRLRSCLEKSEMIQLLKSFRDTVVCLPVRFSDLWFGSYASSVIDSKRTVITNEELCNPRGFNVYFKILQDEVWDQADMAELQPYEGHEGVMLFHHSASYFNPDGAFVMEMKDPESHYPIDLRWRSANNMVQVGPYPHLVVTRNEEDWGWKLENVHVVMLLRDTKANYSDPDRASSGRDTNQRSSH